MPVEKKIAKGFAWPLVLLIIIGAASYSSLLRQQEDVRWVQHTHEVIEHLQMLLGAMTDAETGMRGFVITGEEPFLEPFRDAVSKVPTIVQKLRQLISDNPVQQREFALLEPLLAQRLALCRRNEQLRRTEGFAAAQRRSLSGDGKAVHDAIRRQIGMMQETEYQLLKQRNAQAARSLAATQAVIIILTLAAFASVGISFRRIYHELAGRQRAEGALREAHDQLEERVQRRTAQLEEAANQLQASQARLASAVRIARLGHWDLEMRTQHLQWSDFMHELTGVEKADFKGTWEQILTLIHPEDADLVQKKMGAVVERGEPLDLQHRMLKPDGTVWWMHARAEVERDAEGRVIFLHGTAMDVTERKEAEKRAVWLASFPERNPNPIVEMERDSGIVHYANPAAVKLFPELLEQRLRNPLLAGLPEAARPLFGGSRAVLHREAAVDGAFYAQTVTYISETQRLRVYSSDISARREAEQALQILNAELEARVSDRTAQLEAANRELESFSYSVSHDLRSPLRSIAGFSHALEKECRAQLDETGRGYLQRVRAATERMALLIDDLLNLSRVTRAEMTRQPVDLSALARSIVAELRQQAPERQVTIEIEDGLVAQGDPRLLRVVLENLFGNAWKFTQKKPQSTIAFHRESTDHNASVFSLRDDGAGFDMRYAGKLFGAFQRLHAFTAYPGTGIGLATVQRIILRHGGRVWAEGAVDAGANFFFEIPIPAPP
jgi:PAS domain S-box-containing protein